ncbi:DinB family protein [Streptomyces sp. H27-G5]|uniref:DinB family protein n=1 Tax=Streptomyces sp. H27-G5 TaxID=2996698 RepID=UPI00226F30A2|nr:DinB family protein [Streptomyces sp. H27-G5]MCY0921562.1 DinB family protein [Streptomyces sp. H27-G5]
MTTTKTPRSHEPASATPPPALDAERADLLAALGTARSALLNTVRGLDDDRIGERPTASDLCLGGLIKHVTSMEAGWLRFVVEGPSAMRFDLPDGVTWDEITAGTAREFPQWAIDHRNDFQVAPGETLAGILARYEQVAARTEEIVRAVPDLSAMHPVPDAPWNEPGGVLSVRGTLMHVIAETAQHAGHADILRETLDGQKST